MWSARRFLLILIISFSGLAATQIWYVKSQISFESRNKPIAFIRDTKNEVQQKPGDHLIWKDVGLGQVLYRGDAIRTSADSHCDVVFTKSGSTIFVDENSQIVLDETKGETTLNLLSGSLLAKGNGAAPTVLAGSQRIRLDKEKTELGISVNNNDVSGCVYSGSMSLEGADAKSESYGSGRCNRANIISIVYPSPNATLGRTDKTALTRFEFKGEGNKSVVSLNIGRKKNALEPLATVTDGGPQGHIEAVVPEGVFFWQLVAKDGAKETARSLVMQAEMITASPAVLLVPNDLAVVKTDQPKINVNLSWTPAKLAKEYRVEISKNSDFGKNLVLTTTLSETELLVPLGVGQKYYWRVVTVWKDEKFSPLGSTVRSFSVTPVAKIPAPDLISPIEGTTLALDSARAKGLVFAWSPVSDADLYNLQITFPSGKKLTFETAEPTFRIAKLEAGELEWSVQAQSSFTSSDWARPFPLHIVNELSVDWLSPKVHEVDTDDAKPVVDLEWTPAFGVNQWNLSYDNATKGLSGELRFPSPQAKIELPTGGDWRFRVDGYGSEGSVIAKSEGFLLKINYFPLLPAPNLVDFPQKGVKFIAKGIDLHWEAVPDASSYLIVLSSSGSVIGRYETKNLSYEIPEVVTGLYQIQMSTKNQRGKEGGPGPIYELNLSNESEIPPPDINTLFVH